MLCITCLYHLIFIFPSWLILNLLTFWKRGSFQISTNFAPSACVYFLHFSTLLLHMTLLSLPLPRPLDQIHKTQNSRSRGFTQLRRSVRRPKGWWRGWGAGKRSLLGSQEVGKRQKPGSRTNVGGLLQVHPALPASGPSSQHSAISSELLRASSVRWGLQRLPHDPVTLQKLHLWTCGPLGSILGLNPNTCQSSPRLYWATVDSYKHVLKALL